MELKEKIKRQWGRSMVQSRQDVVGLDSSVILPRETWEASARRDFSDPLPSASPATSASGPTTSRRSTPEEGPRGPRHRRPRDAGVPNCGTGGAWTEPRQFSGLLKSYLGVVEDAAACTTCVPRPRRGSFSTSRRGHERAPQAAFASPRSARASATRSCPQFHLPHREFEQMEMEFFVKPGEDEEWHQYWIDQRTAWATAWASTRRTCATSSTRRRSSAITPSAPSTSSTASTSPVRSRASSRGSRPAPTST